MGIIAIQFYDKTSILSHQREMEFMRKIIYLNDSTRLSMDDDNNVQLQQLTWNGKDYVSIYINKDEVSKLIELLQEIKK